MKKTIIVAAVAAAFAMVSCQKEPVLDVVANFTSDEVSYNGTALTADVTSANGSWTATCDVDWVTIEPATGDGSKTIRFIVAANETKQSRKATVTITLSSLVKTLEINQEAHPKDAIDDIAFTGGNKITYTINNSGKYYTGVATKAELAGSAEMLNDGDLNLTMIQMCSGIMAGDVLTVEAPAEASFEGKTVTWFMNMFGGSEIKAGETFTIFAIPVEVADENDKSRFNEIVTVEFKAE
ncbi:MAG: BACON domain-containing protein [Bacteroidales bacterium]|nr:BACON domain-containing protein [Bacteroidales bacterium]